MSERPGRSSAGTPGAWPGAEEPSAERTRLIGQEGPEGLPRLYVARDVMAFVESCVRRGGAEGSAGFLMGRSLLNPSGRRFVLIDGAIESPEVEAAGRSVKLTPRAWKALRAAASSAFQGREVMGWFHGRPGEPPYLSPYETFVHQTHFGAPWQVALVVDPEAGHAAWWAWQGEALERLPGFRLWESAPSGLLTARELARLGLYEPAGPQPAADREAAAAGWQRGVWPASRVAEVTAERRGRRTGEAAGRSRLARAVRVLQGATVLVLVFVGAMLARWGLERVWPQLAGRPAPWASPTAEQGAAAPAPGASGAPGALEGSQVMGGGPATPALPGVVPPPAADTSGGPDSPAPAVPAQGSAPTAQGPAGVQRYRVQRGDSLWLIADRFYGDPALFRWIAQANGLDDPNRLVAGQELLLPPLAGSAPGRK